MIAYLLPVQTTMECRIYQMQSMNRISRREPIQGHTQISGSFSYHMDYRRHVPMHANTSLAGVFRTREDHIAILLADFCKITKRLKFMF